MKIHTLIVGTVIAISHVGYGMDDVADKVNYIIPKALPCEKGISAIVDDLLKQMRDQRIPTILLNKHTAFLRVLEDPALDMETLMNELVHFQKAAMTILSQEGD